MKVKGLTTFSSMAVVVRYVCFQAVPVYFCVLVSYSDIVSYLYEYKLWFLEECVQDMFNCVSDDCLMFRSKQFFCVVTNAVVSV